ncbi:type II secretion system protein [Shewanella gaetbuli]
MNFKRLSSKPNGFSLVELVTTIILIGIMAAVVLPRFFSQSSYSAYTVRNEFISELRQAQLRALNNTDRCFEINVTPSGYQLRQYADRSGTACSSLIRSEALQGFSGDATVSLTLSASQTFTITYDALGRIISPSCSGPCFDINADETLQIAIESEGYIYAL